MVPMPGGLTFRAGLACPRAEPGAHWAQQRKTPEDRAAAHGLGVEEVGPITSERLLAFIWQAAGRAEEATEGWERERPLMVVLDKYSVHTSEVVEAATAELKAAGVYLEYLPSYSPELSRIEPDWNDIKQHHLPIRSFEKVADLKRAVDDALARKAHQIQQAHAKTINLRRADT